MAKLLLAGGAVAECHREETVARESHREDVAGRGTVAELLLAGGIYSSFVRTKSLLTISVSEKNSIAKTLMVVYAGTAMSIQIIPAIWPPIIIIRKI